METPCIVVHRNRRSFFNNQLKGNGRRVNALLLCFSIQRPRAVKKEMYNNVIKALHFMLAVQEIYAGL